MFSGSWQEVINFSGAVISFTSTEFIIENDDGTQSRYYGTGFTYPGGVPTGTFTSAERFDPATSTVLISYTGISRDFATLISVTNDAASWETILASYMPTINLALFEQLTSTPTLITIPLANGTTMEIVGTGLNLSSDTIAGFGTITEVRLIAADGITVLQSDSGLSLNGGAASSSSIMNFFLGEGNPTVTTTNYFDDFAVYGGANNIVYDGLFGNLDFSESASAVNVDIAANTVTRGAVTDTISGGFDNVYGSRFNDNIIGNANNNNLNSGDGNDVISGQGGDDTIDAGGGDWNAIDTGTGNDTVTFQNSGASFNSINYSNLNAAITVDLTYQNSLGLVNKGVNGFDTILYLNNTTDTSINNSGLGIYGTNFADVFNLDISENDHSWMQVRGLGGNDTFNLASGWVRLDYIQSPTGIIANLAAGTIQDGHGGTDTITGSFTGFEVRGTDQVDSFIGSANDDRFITRGGDDVVDGGLGFDRVRYDRSGVDAVVVDLTAGTASGNWNGLAFTDTLTSIEWIRGSRSGNDTITGSGADERFETYDGIDTINAGGGNDYISAGGGNDIINGGAGDDRIVGGTGNDALTGGADADIFQTSTGDGQDTVSDFTIADGDRVDVSGHGIQDFASLTINSINGGADSEIDFGGGDRIILTGVIAASLTSSAFVFFSPLPVATVNQVAGGSFDTFIAEGWYSHSIAGGTSSTQYTTQHDSIMGVSTVYDGSGFTFSGGNVTGGTISSVTFVGPNGTRAVFSGLQVDAVEFADALIASDAGDNTALDAILNSYQITYTAAGATGGAVVTFADLLEGMNLTGSAFSDTLTGGRGDDMIDPGTSSGGGNTVIASWGNDTIDFGNGAGSFQSVNYSGTLNEIRVHVTATSATIHKGRYGFDTIINLDDAISDAWFSSTKGFGIHGTAYNDIFILDGGVNSWMQVTGNAGDDIYQCGVGLRARSL